MVGYGGYWRVVRAIGRHRIDVCQGDDSGWTYGNVWARFGNTWRLRSQRARVCWAAIQTVNGLPSTHAACKRFWLVGGS